MSKFGYFEPLVEYMDIYNLTRMASTDLRQMTLLCDFRIAPRISEFFLVHGIAPQHWSGMCFFIPELIDGKEAFIGLGDIPADLLQRKFVGSRGDRRHVGIIKHEPDR